MPEKLVVGIPDMEIHKSARLMFNRKIKKLSIVENGKHVGLITLTSIARTVSVDQGVIDIVKKIPNMCAI